MLLVPQTAAATWRVLRALVCVLFSFFVFSLVLRLTLFTSSGVFVLFFQLVLFKCLPHCLRGGHDSLFLLFFLIFLSFFSFSLSICLHFLFVCFLSFLYFIECVCRACGLQYDDMALHCPLLCLLRTWQRGISVA